MSETVNESVDLSNPTVVESLLDNPDIRKLPVGSEAFKAAAQELLSKKDTVTSEDDATAGDENTDDASEAEENSEDDKEVKTSKKGKGLQSRIDELVREKAELKRRLEQQDNAKNSAPAERSTASDNSDSGYNVPKPKFADFDSLEDYTDAVTDWKLDKREFEKKQEAAKQAETEYVEKFKKTWEERENATKKEFPDYHDYVNVESLKAVNPSDDVKAFLADSEVGPKLTYTLLKDDELLDSFLKASPLRQIAILGKIEDRLLAETESEDRTEKKTTVTRAPAPTRSLPKGKAVATVKDIYDPNLSFAEFDQAMKERERRNKGK